MPNANALILDDFRPLRPLNETGSGNFDMNRKGNRQTRFVILGKSHVHLKLKKGVFKPLPRHPQPEIRLLENVLE